MFYQNFKIAWRSLSKQKLYSFVNILGLGFGMACFLLIALFAISEMTFDGFHQKGENIYRVIQHRELPSLGKQSFGAVSLNAGLAAKNKIAGVDESVRLIEWGKGDFRNTENQQGFYRPLYLADQPFFDIFDFPLTQGNSSTVLEEPFSLVVSESFAKLLFGNENPIGKTVFNSQFDADLKVTGVFKNVPNNSHMQFDLILSLATMNERGWYSRNISDWSSQNWTTYLLLNPKANPQQIGNQLTALAEIRSSEQRPFQGKLELQPLKDIHFESEGFLQDWNMRKSSRFYLYIFSLIGIFILGIACFNYINLTTARAINYSMEIGVRKVIGANLKQLISRFLSESVILVGGAFLLTIALLQIGLPWFNEFTDKTISLNPFTSPWTFPLLISTTFLVSLLAGGYPSLYLSRMKTSAVLQGHQGGKRSKGTLRQGLVVLQFSLSIFMIIGTLIVWQQMNFVQNQDLGFNQDQLMVVDINSGAVRNNFNTIQNQYEQIPEVKSVSVSSRVPGEWKNIRQAVVSTPQQIESKFTPWFMGTDENFLETFKIELASGRNFDRSRPLDSASVILNQKAANVLGITAATGQTIQLLGRFSNGSERLFETPMNVSVIGIVKDFNFQSLYEPVTPLVLGYRNNPIQSIDYFTARISPQNIDRTIAQMTDILHTVDPNHVFEYHFLDDQIANFYQADNRRGQLFTIAALCAIFISSLGLFGLAAFMAEQRIKEIGIRKVLGASVSGIVTLLSKDFLRLVMIAFMIASPLAYFVMSEWLQDFAFRINISLWIFLGAGILTIVIALFTISFHSVKAAVSNPVNNLKE